MNGWPVSFPVWCLLVAGCWLAYVLLAPSLIVVWAHRRLLRRWVWMTVRHPLLMLASAQEVRAETHQKGSSSASEKKGLT